jgi:hypothetical protein
MLILKSLLGGAALAGLFEIYVKEVSGNRDNLGALSGSLVALAVVFLVSNLLHWWAFRNPRERAVLRKFAYSVGLWFSFFICSLVTGVTLHRGIAAALDPTPLRMVPLLLSFMGFLGLPFAFLNCLIANWSVPIVPTQKAGSVRAFVRKLTNSPAA